MMDDLFNNIYIWHKGTKVSIAQHYDCPSSKYDGEACIQEVAIIPEDGSTWDTAYIKRYGTTLTHLIQVLEGIRDEIDQEVHNESSGKGVA